MKGITPVIAIILLIMITISMVSFMFVWFTGFLETLTSQTEQQLAEQERQRQMGISIIDADGSSGNVIVSLRNTGTVEIRAGELTIIVKNATGTATYTYTPAIAPGYIVTNEDTGISCPSDEEVEIRADIPGLNDDMTTILCP